MTTPTFDHSKCNNAWKQVKCDRCGRQYQCTPSSDYYCAAEGDDHCCESCLLGGTPLVFAGTVADLREAVDRGDLS
jgi:uncharacterized protein CbrC (UPF0167 family)